MKKIQFSSRGRLCAMLAVSVLAISGCAMRGVSAGQKFGDVAIQDIGRNWDVKVLDQYAGPEFYKQCPPERAKEICALLKDKLGPIKPDGYKGSTISPNFPSPSPGSMAPLVMGMKGEAEFEKAPGNVTLIVAEHDGRWTLNGFQVQSAALMNAQGAQNGPRSLPPGMRPGGQLPPGTQLPPQIKLPPGTKLTPGAQLTLPPPGAQPASAGPGSAPTLAPGPATPVAPPAGAPTPAVAEPLQAPTEH